MGRPVYSLTSNYLTLSIKKKFTLSILYILYILFFLLYSLFLSYSGRCLCLWICSLLLVDLLALGLLAWLGSVVVACLSFGTCLALVDRLAFADGIFAHPFSLFPHVPFSVHNCCCTQLSPLFRRPTSNRRLLNTKQQHRLSVAFQFSHKLAIAV